MTSIKPVFVVKVSVPYEEKGRVRRILEQFRFIEYQTPNSNDTTRHICVGNDSQETLCGCTAITSVTQSDEPTEFGTVCESCETEFEELDVQPEPTIACHRCGSQYGASKARIVPSNDENVEVCKPCYEDIQASNDTPVVEPYEEATPPLELEMTEA